MKIETNYIAADGKKFDSQEDCLVYEKGLENEKNIHCFVDEWECGDWENIDSDEDKFKRCNFIVFDNRAAAEWYKKKMAGNYLNVFGNEYGYNIDEYDNSEFPIAFLYKDHRRWVDYTEYQERLQAEIDTITSLVYNKQPF